jgi:hypothetical protein
VARRLGKIVNGKFVPNNACALLFAKDPCAKFPGCKPTQSLSFALRFNGRKRVHDADQTMARITAGRLVEHLGRSGYVVMHKPGLGQHGAPGNLAGWIEKATKSHPAQPFGAIGLVARHQCPVIVPSCA